MFLMVLCLHGTEQVKATEMSFVHPEAEMKVGAGRQDLGHFDNSNSSSRKEKWYRKEEREWKM